jgi:hypothetical protein
MHASLRPRAPASRFPDLFCLPQVPVLMSGQNRETGEELYRIRASKGEVTLTRLRIHLNAVTTAQNPGFKVRFCRATSSSVG